MASAFNDVCNKKKRRAKSKSISETGDLNTWKMLETDLPFSCSLLDQFKEYETHCDLLSWMATGRFFCQ
jgi:hypothetical protein